MASLQPIFAIALGVVLLKERPNLLVSIGTPMVVGVLVMVLLTEIANSPAERAINPRTLGYLLAAGSAAAFASRDVIGTHVVTGVAPPYNGGSIRTGHRRVHTASDNLPRCAK